MLTSWLGLYWGWGAVLARTGEDDDGWVGWGPLVAVVLGFAYTGGWIENESTRDCRSGRIECACDNPARVGQSAALTRLVDVGTRAGPGDGSGRGDGAHLWLPPPSVQIAARFLIDLAVECNASPLPDHHPARRDDVHERGALWVVEREPDVDGHVVPRGRVHDRQRAVEAQQQQRTAIIKR